MDRRSLFAVYFLFLTFALNAQDDYHADLQSQLQTNYGLPAGNWVLNNTEVANLMSDFSYGNVTAADADASGQAFSKKVTLDVDLMSGPQWNAGYGINNINSVDATDVCLVVFWARADQGGKISLSIQNSSTFESEFYQTMPIGDVWSQYIFPLELSSDYGAGELQFAFQLNWQDQLVELGGLAVLDYGTSVDSEDLPLEINNEFYGGYEPDAPWRAEATQRIEQLRKADLEILVVDNMGNPVEGATVEVNMIEHEFGFGTAVAAHLIAGNSQQNNTYEDHLLDLDGEGHRFNCIVFENATKWNAWENNWFGVDQEDKANTVQWLKDHGFKVRGHTLIWPSWTNLPNDIEASQNDPDYVKGRVLDHIEDILTYPGLAGAFSDWDVLNEISVLNDLANTMQGAPGYTTGREIYLDILEKYYEIEPEGIAYINDYTTFGAGSSQQAYNDLKTYVQEILDAGMDVDGIGFQGHIAAYPTAITEVYAILEDFHSTFDTDAKITEFDMNALVGDDLAAQYLRDFYTISFSHPSVDAIVMWGFWDGAHWFDNAPMFRPDWSLKPAGEAFIDLVFDEWWTTENGTTNAAGSYEIRGFKGSYEVIVDCPGGTFVDTIELASNMSITIDCSTTISTSQIANGLNLKVYPNPSTGLIRVEWEGGQSANIQLYDQMGRKLSETSSAHSPLQWELDLPNGVYQLIINAEGVMTTHKLIID